MQNYTLLISDLHLQQENSLVTERFFKFIDQEAKTADALYILGDFFEVWIGDDDITPFNQKISQTLQKLAQKNVPIFFIHGNRDFVLGKRFAKQSGFRLLDDPTVINLYGTRVLISHGDALCTLDIRHQKFRQFMLNPFWQRILLSIPLFFRRKIAKRIREKSREHNRQNPSYIMDVTPSAVTKIMQDNQVKLLIHGHTHRPDIHPLTIDGEEAARIVMGAWHDHAEYVKFYADGSYELVPLVS